MEGEPFPGHHAKRLIKGILRDGNVALTRHAREEMEKDDLIVEDVQNVLRGGQITEPAEEVRGTWRYRVRTNRIFVVVAFRSESELVVVTVWRLQS